MSKSIFQKRATEILFLWGDITALHTILSLADRATMSEEALDALFDQIDNIKTRYETIFINTPDGISNFPDASTGIQGTE